MKYLVASDIHGSALGAEKIIEKFTQNKCDKIILLGDILYHGPRNPLPDEYNPQKVTEILNKFSEKIIAVKGNCDAEVDQMVLNFNLNESALLQINNRTIFCTHGGHINPERPAKLAKNTIVLYGHFHKVCKNLIDDVTYINVGSISLPKGGTPKCYGILDEKGIKIFDLEDKIFEVFDF